MDLISFDNTIFNFKNNKLKIESFIKYHLINNYTVPKLKKKRKIIKQKNALFKISSRL